MKSSSAQRQHRWIQAGPGMPCQRYAASYETAGNDDQKVVASSFTIVAVRSARKSPGAGASGRLARSRRQGVKYVRQQRPAFALGAQPRIGHCKLFCNLKSI